MGRAYAALGGPLVTQCGDTSLFPQQPYLTCLDGTQEVRVYTDRLRTNLTPNGTWLPISDPNGLISLSTSGDTTTVNVSGGGASFRAAVCPGNIVNRLKSGDWFQVEIGDMQAGAMLGADDACMINISSAGSVLGSLGLDNISVTPLETGWYKVSARLTVDAVVHQSIVYSSSAFGSEAMSGVALRFRKWCSGRSIEDINGRYIPTNSSAVTELDATYSVQSGQIVFARSATGVKSNSADCTGSGVTWQVPPLLF